MIFYPKILSTSIAVLGKTGSGKSSTVKLAVERIVAGGGRVCVLDPIKSDYWGLTSSVDGKKPGLPFTILGGPRGHVPITASAGRAVGSLVASGKLPLSIVDMAEFGAGGSLRFFNAFAEILCKELRGVLHLVIEEAHEFAPKERIGVGEENMAIYWTKRLATGMRSKGLRLIVATHRVQSLHNAVLGSCETMIAHRVIAPADQKPVLDWFKANATKVQAAAVAADLAKLATGTGYLFAGEADLFQKVAFPKFSTFDNTRTPEGDGPKDHAVVYKLDSNALKALIGSAVEEAETNDPVALKAKVAELQKQLASVSTSIDRPEKGSDIVEEMEMARTQGYDKGYMQGVRIARKAALEDLQIAADVVQGAINDALAGFARQIPAEDAEPFCSKAAPPAVESKAAAPILAPEAKKPPLARPASANEVSPLPGPEQRIVNALAWWRALGILEPNRAQVAMVAGYSPTSSSFQTYLSRLVGKHLISYPRPGLLTLGWAGETLAAVEDVFHHSAFGAIRDVIAPPLFRILSAIIDLGGGPVSRADIAARAGNQLTSSSFQTYLSRLVALGLAEYPKPGMVKISDWVMK